MAMAAPGPWLSSRTHRTTTFALARVSMCFILLSMQNVVASATSYPPSFNVALNKNVTVVPTTAVCGIPSRDQICRSSTDSGTADSCWQEDCNSRCPGEITLPAVQGVFETSRSSGWGNCISRDYTVVRPGSKIYMTALFKGSGSRCFLTIDPSFMVPIRLSSQWSIAVSTWIYSQLAGRSGTLLQIQDTNDNTLLRIDLDASSQVRVFSGPTQYKTDTSWKIKGSTWTHLVLQIHGGSFSVFIDGALRYPAVHNFPLKSSSDASKFYVGKSMESNDTFVGRMDDFKIYLKSISNRGVQQVYNGTFPKERIYSDCRCSPSHPQLKSSDPTYCVQNGGPGQSSSALYRLNRFSHPLEFINDGKKDTHWISKPGTRTTTVAINLEQVYEVLQVVVSFYSPPSNTLTIERRASEISPWQPWQYFSTNCKDEVSKPQDGPLVRDDDVNCLSIVPPNTPMPYSQGEVTFDLLSSSRPGHNGTEYSTTLRAFLKAYSVRVRFDKHPFVKNAQHKYHGIQEVKVVGRCDCYGHASSCDVTKDRYVCGCTKESHAYGRKCDLCVPGSYYHNSGDRYADDFCMPCRCDTTGTVGAQTMCSQSTAQCNCKRNVQGLRCNTCKDGFFQLHLSNPDGCTACQCKQGTQNGATCDKGTGKCPCKKNVLGFLCDRCKDNHFGLSATKRDGCDACDCNSDGLIPGSTGCDVGSGQCNCKANVTGRQCDTCVAGTWGLTASNPLGCQECRCDMKGSLSAVCNRTTGQCPCKLNVAGKHCDKCASGYYARTPAEFKASGCQFKCNCDPYGTTKATSCDGMTGDCICKANVEGTRCQRCKKDTYGRSASNPLGCSECGCNVSGTLKGTTKCDVTTGVCPCKDNVRDRDCSRCKTNMYGLSAANPKGCFPCDCYGGGTLPGQYCDVEIGQCPCRDGGDKSLAGRQCKPYITKMIPRYGPMSGGTFIEIHGGFLGNASIEVGNTTCKPAAGSTDRLLKCLTSSIGKESSDIIGNPQPVRVELSDGFIVMPESTSTFTYKRDPKIISVEPLSTFLRGGLVITVTGKYLDSVARPLMEITMVWRNSKKVFVSACNATSGEVLQCTTPEIELPQQFRSKGNRVRRDAPSTTAHEELNDEDLRFYMGFKLDGLTMYRNLSKTMPKYGTIKVYQNPAFERFTEIGEVKVYRPFWPFGHETITIKGKRLDLAASKDDYKIQIGKEFCANISLSSTEIACSPPSKQPVPDESGHSQDGSRSPRVLVSVGRLKNSIGYLRYEHDLWEYTPFRYGVIGAASGIILLIILTVAIVCLVRARRWDTEKKPRHLEMSSTKSANPYISAYYSGGSSGYLNPNLDILELLPDDLKIKVEESIIDFKRLTLGKNIGEGMFGVVQVGKLSDHSGYNSVHVAMKTIKDSSVNPRDIILFLEEATIMKDFKHTNILNLIGVSFASNKPFVILPYMENGDLKTFISSETNMITVGELIHFGLQVSEGMKYLSFQKFVHRDLAARNCMVSKDLIVKIADFGLSRDIYENDYYQQGDMKRPLPIKWMAPESLEKGLFNVKTDVWSFGILLWELMTRGCTPYPDIDTFDIKNYLNLGHRMDKPDYAPQEVYLIMQQCWEADPYLRPDFRDLCVKLLAIIEGQHAQTAKRKNWILHGNNYMEIAG